MFEHSLYIKQNHLCNFGRLNATLCFGETMILNLSSKLSTENSRDDVVVVVYKKDLQLLGIPLTILY